MECRGRAALQRRVEAKENGTESPRDGRTAAREPEIKHIEIIAESRNVREA
jgi:hypothetical protein